MQLNTTWLPAELSHASQPTQGTLLPLDDYVIYMSMGNKHAMMFMTGISLVQQSSCS